MQIPFNLLRSFRSRILALVLCIVTLVLSAAVVAIVVEARAAVDRDAATRLGAAADSARGVLRFRGNQLSSAAEVLTSDFGFREAIAQADQATLKTALANHGARIGADVMIAMDPAGRPLASTLSELSPATQADLQELVVADADGELLRLYRLIDGRPYQLVVAPILGPDPVGWTALGFALDDKVAQDMSALLGVDVSFVVGAARGATFVGSSRARFQRGDLQAVTSHPAGSPFLVSTGTDEFLTWNAPIRSANGSLTLVLQRSLTAALQPYTQLRNAILLIGLFILGVATVLATLLSRSATRPVAELTLAAERLEAGDYSTEAPPATTTEFSRLGSAFNTMRTAVAERERTILHQASHDTLTGLPTRDRMTEDLDTLLVGVRRNHGTLAVLLVEIEDLQDVVGSFGHQAADELLREMARRLCLGAQGRVSRIGSAQFAVIAEGVDLRQAPQAAREVSARLRAAYDYRGVSLQVQTRIGIGVFPEDGGRAAELLQCADLALYRAREEGTAIGTFVRGDDEVHRHRLAVLGDLRRAIGANELELHFQPKVSVPTGLPVGCEALVRWRHPQKGFIPPGEFIPDAERTGLIRLVSAWVLETAFRYVRAWHNVGLAIDVSINVSPADLADPAFADLVTELLAQTRADATRIILEITETAAMKDLPKTLAVMEQLRVVGIRFSIDDFGTGYSSLAHLRRLPVDEIKIDRSFIRELETRRADDVIVRSTVELGHALNLKVVAEGVEVAHSWDLLKDMGCDLVQGYFIAKPMPAAEFADWARARLQTKSDDESPGRALRRSLRAVHSG